MTTPEHTFEALCVRSEAISREKGWITDTDARPYYTTVALFHSELSEALEEFRANRALNEVYYECTFKKDDGEKVKQEVALADIDAARKVEGKYGRGTEFLDAKPAGIPIELADFIIRIAQRVGSDKKFKEFAKSVESVSLDVDKELPSDFTQFLVEVHASISASFIEEVEEGNYIPWVASAVTYVFEFCENNGIDLWAAIDEKEAFNRTRPMRHGGKRC